MSNCCCGICHFVKQRYNTQTGGMMFNGFKLCNTCKCYLLATVCVLVGGKLACPCCHCYVRHSPRHKNRSPHWNRNKNLKRM